MKRSDVYELIDGERLYQDSLWHGSITCANAVHGPNHSIEEWLLYIDDYLHEAKHVAGRKAFPDAIPEIMSIIRKIAAMTVICMEQHDAPPRNMEDLSQSKAKHLICEPKSSFDTNLHKLAEAIHPCCGCSCSVCATGHQAGAHDQKCLNSLVKRARGFKSQANG